MDRNAIATRAAAHEQLRFSELYSEQLRALLDSGTPLAQCLQAIEDRGKGMHQCPHCGHERLYRHGYGGGLQRYRCRLCRKTCNALTNTPLAFLRLRGKWLPFLECALRAESVRGAAASVGIHRNTSFRWRKRFGAQQEPAAGDG